MTSATAPEIWAIGDIQGCARALRGLLSHPALADAHLWFAGDLVNRGPDSLGALRLIKSLGPRASVVLGNHDLHLLAVASGVRRLSKSDTFQDILQSRDAPELLDWLRRQPLMVRAHGHVMVHAGILPSWTLDEAQALAGEIEAALRGPDWRAALNEMYGESPKRWKPSLEGPERLQVIVNALTRMRVCHADGKMNLKHKGPPPKQNEPLQPWFDVPGKRDLNETVIFGHWSALGLMIRPDAICLDTGCVWQRALTALRLSDHQTIEHSCADCR